MRIAITSLFLLCSLAHSKPLPQAPQQGCGRPSLVIDQFAGVPDYETCCAFSKAAHENFYHLCKIRDIGGWPAEQAKPHMEEAKLTMWLWAACWRLRVPSWDPRVAPHYLKLELYVEIQALKAKLGLP